MHVTSKLGVLLDASSPNPPDFLAGRPRRWFQEALHSDSVDLFALNALVAAAARVGQLELAERYLHLAREMGEAGRFWVGSRGVGVANDWRWSWHVRAIV